MVKKCGKKKFVFCAIIPALYTFLVKILLVKLKYLYIPYAWILIKKNEDSNQNVKVEKMVVLVKTYDKFQIF